ncbi:MAG: polymer-forming cytoskeletal protein [Tannerella sp.]|jgi:cytoskeletal protein CcmA (bactofilin family)|nr:polymer-forming cytoskeletal protein [Tannerella sp.]
MMRTRQEEIEVVSNSGGVHNVLAGGTIVSGTINTEADFRLDGRIEGDINCKGKIVVGPKGSIKGNIISDHAEILGYVEGSIRIKEKLIFKSSANIKGDIYTQTLEIEPGALFNGTCTMSGKNPLEGMDKNPKINLAGAQQHAPTTA